MERKPTDTELLDLLEQKKPKPLMQYGFNCQGQVRPGPPAGPPEPFVVEIDASLPCIALARALVRNGLTLSLNPYTRRLKISASEHMPAPPAGEPC